MDQLVIEESERLAWCRLLATDGIGLDTARRLVRAMGSPSAVLSADLQQWRMVEGMAESMAVRLRKTLARTNLKAECRWLGRNGGRHVSFGCVDYPPLLIPCPDPPGMLRCRGLLPSIDMPCVAIVGTRRATTYGLRQAARLTCGLVEQGCCVVSGGARGIDAEVHRTALRLGGKTVVVLGSGLARPYPPEHEGLFERVVDHGGAIISEVHIHQPPRPGLFPRRNRVISGISHAVVMVEAPHRSGAMITARLAVEEHGRDAMAVPGPADASTSAGCHRAIREGWAHLVTSAEDVISCLQSDYTASVALTVNSDA